MTTAWRSNRQRTVKGVVTLMGPGLHSGEECTVAIRPAAADTGILFSANGVSIPGTVESVIGIARGTTLGCGNARIMTVEHLMAALWGAGVDNAIVEIAGPEAPALDGSSKPFVDALFEIGLTEQDADRALFELREPVWVADEDAFILAAPCEIFKIDYVLRYDHPMIGSQALAFDFDEEHFRSEIAPARTFVLYEEVESLISRHLARGGSLSNTIVVYNDHLSCDLRFQDELVRHKALDIIGDCALIGRRICAEIVAVRSGHKLNVELAKKIREMG